jgi:hypothetical protein
MAAGFRTGKFYTLFTVIGAFLNWPGSESGVTSEDRMGGIAIALFVALFAFGGKYFGWDDPDSKVRLAMAACFILGSIGGYRARS